MDEPSAWRIREALYAQECQGRHTHFVPWQPEPPQSCAPTIQEMTQALQEAHRREDRLRERLSTLQAENARLRAQSCAALAPEAVFKELLTLCHPDKWQGHPLAHELTVRLNQWRQPRKGSYG